MANFRQLSFAAGEIAPALYARTDQAKYATGLRTCRNMFVQKHGGVANRPGLQFIGELKNSTRKARLLKFVYNDDQTYILEFGDRYIRFIRNRGYITASGALWVIATSYKVGDLVSKNFGGLYYCLSDHTSAAASEPEVGADWQTVWYPLNLLSGVPSILSLRYEIPTPYLESELSAIQYVQSADVVTLVHPNHPPYELLRFDHTRWILRPINFLPDIATPGTPGLSGGSAGVDQHWAVTAVADITGEESLPAKVSAPNRLPGSLTPTIISINPVPKAIEYNFYRSSDGITFGLIGTVGGTPGLLFDNAWVDTDETVVGSIFGTYTPAAGQARNTLALTAKAFDGRYTIKGTVELSVGGGDSNLFYRGQGRVRAYYSRDGEARVDAGLLVGASISVFGNGHKAPVAFSGTIEVPDNGYTTLTIDLVPEVALFGSSVSGPVATLTVSFVSSPNNRVEWSAVVVGGGGTVQLADVGAAPDFSIQPPSDPKVFNAPGKYPSTVAYYQQRQLYGGSTLEPEKIWASRIGHFKSFSSSSPIQDDDALNFTLVGNRVNAVRHLLDFGQLIALTSNSGWVIRGNEAGILLPDAINPVKAAGNGSQVNLPPLHVGTSVLYVQARRGIVRDLFLSGDAGYEGNDLTVFSSHLMRSVELVEWDYQETPHSILWIVRSDGVLLGLTYLREHAVLGWHRHDTDGVIESVCSIPEGTEDALYVIVRRTINGQTKRYVEALKTRLITTQDQMFFVDSGLTYDGWNKAATTMTLSGGTAWDPSEDLTITASASTFVPSDVGNQIVFIATDGKQVRITLNTYTSGTIMVGKASRTVPVDLRNAAKTLWGKAVDEFVGLNHLEGKKVSILGDGFVEASGIRTDLTPVTVVGGTITTSRPYVVVHIGLPYLSDVETLDIDRPSGSSMRDDKKDINHITGFIEESRGAHYGRQVSIGSDPLLNMYEMKPRDEETDPDAPPSLITDQVDVSVQGEWDHAGRVFIRQADPLPLTILALMPGGYI